SVLRVRICRVSVATRPMVASLSFHRFHNKTERSEKARERERKDRIEGTFLYVDPVVTPRRIQHLVLPKHPHPVRLSREHTAKAPANYSSPLTCVKPDRNALRNYVP